MAHSIREAINDGVGEYRFLRGDEPYKWRFSDDDPGVETVAVANGVVGGASLTAAVAALAMPSETRRRLVGLAGLSHASVDDVAPAPPSGV